MTVDIQQLEKLYFDGSKHSVYQNIPEFVQQALGYSVKIDEHWRGDTARWQNLLQFLNAEEIRSLGDIGANTGFFALSLAHRFPRMQVTAYEANANHTHFMRSIVSQFALQNVEVKELFVDLEGIAQIDEHDCLLNFNVLHHAGVDYDQDIVALESFGGYAREYLSRLGGKSQNMIFQMGFHWGGNKQKPIVHVNDDVGKVLYMGELFRQSGWHIEHIFTVQRSGVWRYAQMDSEIVDSLNNNRSDAKTLLQEYYGKYNLHEFSEFYRRPLFYCRRK